MKYFCYTVLGYLVLGVLVYFAWNIIGHFLLGYKALTFATSIGIGVIIDIVLGIIQSVKIKIKGACKFWKKSK